jgi:hypothetical protein
VQLTLNERINAMGIIGICECSGPEDCDNDIREHEDIQDPDDNEYLGPEDEEANAEYGYPYYPSEKSGVAGA